MKTFGSKKKQIQKTQTQIILPVVYDILVDSFLKIGQFHDDNNLFVWADKISYQFKS
jgi:hypothetical protein